MKMKKIRLRNRVSLNAILIGIAGFAALGYVAFAASPFISGPFLSASVTQNDDGTFLVTGSTKRVSSVWLNDLPIPITDQGAFSAKRTFPPGYTVAIVRAEDRFGRSREQTLTFVNTHFVDYAEKNTSEESSEEDRQDGNSTERNEGGEESSD